jgi:hypothetical protein
LAREKLDKIGSAFNDAKEALRFQPGDRFTYSIEIGIISFISLKDTYGIVQSIGENEHRKIETSREY